MSHFFEIHSGLVREGPGSPASTRKALQLMTDLPAGPVAVLDIGCGPGEQTVTIAQSLPAAVVIGVDSHLSFVEATRVRARQAGFGDRVSARQGDLAAADVADDPFDAIICEGAAYIMGFEAALAAWRSLVRPGGYLALTEPVWTSPTVPVPVSDFWAGAYPDMQPAQVRRAQIIAAGYKRIGDFALPKADWDAYYGPLRARVDMFRHDPDFDEVVAAHDEEFAIHDNGGELVVGYQYFVMRRPE